MKKSSPYGRKICHWNSNLASPFKFLPGVERVEGKKKKKITWGDGVFGSNPSSHVNCSQAELAENSGFIKLAA